MKYNRGQTAKGKGPFPPSGYGVSGPFHRNLESQYLNEKSRRLGRNAGGLKISVFHTNQLTGLQGFQGDRIAAVIHDLGHIGDNKTDLIRDVVGITGIEKAIDRIGISNTVRKGTDAGRR